MMLTLALVLDAMMGEPRWLWSRLPHPVVLMGRLIGAADQRLNHGAMRRSKGAAVVVCGGALMIVLGMGLHRLGPWVEIPVAAILIAQRSLTDHVSDVARALRIGLPEARRSVARIVGRDSAAMDGAAVARAAVESAAENFSDGVIAPVFWFALGGLPGLLAYKFVNTADSMIGYRTPRHQAFGWAAARTDDVMNLIPARLTAFLLWLPARRGTWRAIARDARQHRSPNAGWPEAAMARALNIALAGPRSYHGRTEQLPWVHPQGHRHPGPEDVARATRLLWQAWGITLIPCMLGALL